MVSPVEEAYIKIKALNEILHILEGSRGITEFNFSDVVLTIENKRDWYIKLKETLEGMIDHA